MLFSIYPTDAPETRRRVVEQAAAQPAPDGGATLLFTSLHLPESAELDAFGDVLARFHRESGVVYCADISPLTIERLGAGIPDTAGLARLAEWGVSMLRIDFGFDAREIVEIAETSGLAIAVNASTADDVLLDALADIPLVGWHNYYPRPETGLTDDFYVSQSARFTDRGLPLFAFLPGESDLRAPLHLGLPTLEVQRHRNAWRNYLQLRRLTPEAVIVCAEGTLLPEHAAWIAHLETTGEVTLPLSGDASSSFLAGEARRLRVEDAAASFRLEGTRGTPRPERVRNGDTRARGSLQMDLDALGRYAGEVHLMRDDLPLTGGQAWVGEIAGPYRGIVGELRPGMAVRFV